MVRNVAPLIRDLEEEDFYLLSGVEHGMRFSEWVDRRKLHEYAGLTKKEVEYRLDRCLELELIERRTIQYEGYRLRFEGYDALALNTFAKRGSVIGVGGPLGEGKESDVLEVRGNEETLSLKFHREGITNFREVHRQRKYTADHEHVSMLYTARIAAEREFDVMTEIHPHLRVPQPIDHNRHAIVMERLPGGELRSTEVSSGDAARILTSVLSELSKAYQAGYIHADASEYNVFVHDTDVWLIDWPQAVGHDHPNAEDLLHRDVRNVIKYFARKHPRLFTGTPEISAAVQHVRQDDVDTWASKTYK